MLFSFQTWQGFIDDTRINLKTILHIFTPLNINCAGALVVVLVLRATITLLCIRVNSEDLTEAEEKDMEGLDQKKTLPPQKESLDSLWLKLLLLLTSS